MHAVRACYLLETDLNRWGFSSRSFSSISRSSGFAACSISSALSTLMLLGGRLRSSNVRMGLDVCRNIWKRYRCLPLFWASAASFILRRASSLETGFDTARNDFQTCSLSSIVFALRNGFKSFSCWLIDQIYRIADNYFLRFEKCVTQPHFFPANSVELLAKSSGCSFLNFSTEAFIKGTAFFVSSSSCSAVNGLGFLGRLLSAKAVLGLYVFLADILDVIHFKEYHPKIVNNKGIFIRTSDFIRGNLLVKSIDSKLIADSILPFCQLTIKINPPTVFRATYHKNKVGSRKDCFFRIKAHHHFSNFDI